MTSPLWTENQNQSQQPRVLISGAGVGGLFLAILLDRAGIPYTIFERAPEVKALGSVLCINANILPVFQQLGIYEEFEKFALPMKALHLVYGDMTKIATLETGNNIDLVGFYYMVFSRPFFYEFLLSKVPARNILFNKKIVSTMQNTEEVMIQCADGTEYFGSILVGADGAYSTVRRSLFDTMRADGVLPAMDDADMNSGYTSLVGMTEPLDPKKYPLPNDESVQHQIIVEGTSYTCSLFNVQDNRVCYVVVRQYDTKAESDKERLRNPEWSSETSEEMIEKVKDFNTPWGTLGDLIDQTPRDKISRVFLEDKLFETWTHERTVLIGDAAHKLLPSGAQGSINAMQDAVILANCLYDLPSLEHSSIKAALQDYKQQRQPQVKIQNDNSNTNAALFFGQTLVERCIRHVIFNWMPKFLMERAVVKDASYRPQVAFLPLAPTRGTGYVLPQKPSKRYQEEQLKKAQVSEATAV